MVRERVTVEVAGGPALSAVVHPGREGPVPFLLVHGLASNARLWDGVGEILAGEGHTAVAVDQRGHGLSDRVDGGFDFPTLAADLAAVVEATCGGPVVAAGQSWGGNVVLELAARHPDLVLAACMVDGGFIALSDTFPSWDEAERMLAPPPLEGMRASDLEAGMRVRFSGWPEEGVQGQLANFELLADGTVRPHLTRDRHMRILRELWSHHPDDAARRLDVPVAVIAAEDGWPGKRERVEAFTGNLALGSVTWVDAHHDVHAQRPELVAGLLLELAREA